MTRYAGGKLGAFLAAAIIFTLSSVPAAATTTGSETYDATITTSSTSGTRVVLASVIHFTGVFNGVGTIVERPNQPGDPDGVSRDDLVFPEGTIHFYNLPPTEFSFSFNGESCTLRGSLDGAVSEVQGGTGIFSNASGSFRGPLTFQGQTARNADGSCNLSQALLHEVDHLSGTGTLSF